MRWIVLSVLFLCSCVPNETFENTIEVTFEDGTTQTITHISHYRVYQLDRMCCETDYPICLEDGIGNEVACDVRSFTVINSKQLKQRTYD